MPNSALKIKLTKEARKEKKNRRTNISDNAQNTSVEREASSTFLRNKIEIVTKKVILLSLLNKEKDVLEGK